MKLYKIESGVPVPLVNQEQKSELRLLLESLEVGQSVVIGRKDMPLETIYHIAKVNRRKFVTRQVNCKGRRVWRTE